jgi:hypothetical protein
MDQPSKSRSKSYSSEDDSEEEEQYSPKASPKSRSKSYSSEDDSEEEEQYSPKASPKSRSPKRSPVVSRSPARSRDMSQSPKKTKSSYSDEEPWPERAPRKRKVVINPRNTYKITLSLPSHLASTMPGIMRSVREDFERRYQFGDLDFSVDKHSITITFPKEIEEFVPEMVRYFYHGETTLLYR